MSSQQVLERLKKERQFQIEYNNAEFTFELPDLTYILQNISGEKSITTFQLALQQIRDWKRVNERFFFEDGSEEELPFDIDLFEYFMKDHPDFSISVLEKIQELCVAKVSRRSEIKKHSTNI